MKWGGGGDLEGGNACVLYLGGGCGALDGILAFDSLDSLCFVIDDALDFCLVETIHDDVFAFRDMDCTGIYDMRGSFPSPRVRRMGAHHVSPKMNSAQLDELLFVHKRGCGILSCRYGRKPVLQPCLPFSSCGARQVGLGSLRPRSRTHL